MVAVSLAPVHPRGCPNAIAPPFGFTFSGSSPASLITASDCAAKASFNSITSMSESFSPAVIHSRILWTFSAACRLVDVAYRATADWAYDYIVKKFWDAEYGGVYWMLDHQGNPLSGRKQIYAQAFAAYGMAQYYRATGKPEAREFAQRLFRLIE